MSVHEIKHPKDFSQFVSNYSLTNNESLFYSPQAVIDECNTFGGNKVPRFVNEFWTSRQRQANSIHEISYRACFKPHLPRFFIKLLTKEGDVVYDPFSGRGTTVIEAALLGRNVISNDINPLSEILCKPRLLIPSIKELEERIKSIPIRNDIKSDIDLSMFFHEQTFCEILSLRNYLSEKRETKKEDEVDLWIRMVATNRLTGHSKGFFSVYTLPPNQALSPEKQEKINKQRKQVPSYRNTKSIILNKSYDLLRDIKAEHVKQLRSISKSANFLTKDARETNEIPDSSVHLTVTSPPFLDIVQYAEDNWLRCWFNNIDVEEVSEKITITRRLEDWCNFISGVFSELYRITKRKAHVAFEVGEVRKGEIKLDEYIVDIGISKGFECYGIIVNEQIFTKTSNIWGVSNNSKGTNTNRIVLFRK
ncbi:MAG: site-specific DNA-methyltransferase [Ignavibacteria bacterium]|nr:site-specific DNA-methyltransferase [Ignavibacteria bacterium]